MMRFNWISLLCLILFSTPIHAKLYKWVDDKGETHYGTSIPPEYAQKASTEISTKGYTKKENERALSKEEIDQIEAEKNRQADAERQKKEQEEQDQRLLNSYPNVDAIIMTRDGKINSLETRIITARENMAKLQETLTENQQRADKLSQTNRPIPTDLASTLKTMQKSMEDNELAIAEYRKQQQEIRLDFSEKLKRYKEITRKKKEKTSATTP